MVPTKEKCATENRNFSHQTFPENTTVSHFDCLFGFKFLPFVFYSVFACWHHINAFTTTILFRLIILVFLCESVCLARPLLVLHSPPNSADLPIRWLLCAQTHPFNSKSVFLSEFIRRRRRCCCYCFFFHFWRDLYIYYVHCACFLSAVQCRFHASHSGTCTSFDSVINVKRSLYAFTKHRMIVWVLY